MVEKMNKTGDSIVIVGGGVIGAACAYYLVREGWSVTLVDRGEFGKGCSHGNCGYVCPSHVLPLTQPGAIREHLLGVFRRDAPLRIKPHWNPRLWRWLFQFARQCRDDLMLESAHARHQLLCSSTALYRELLAAETIDCDWETQGLLYVFQDLEPLEEFTAVVEFLRKEFGVSATRYDPRQLQEVEPALCRDVAGAYCFEEDAHLRSNKLLAGWRQILNQRGVKIMEHCQVESLVVQSGQARAISTSGGEISASHFVIATGAWTPQFERQLGCKIPIQPGKGYSITMPRPDLCPRFPMLFEQHHVAVTPWASGYRLGSTMEFAGYDTTIDPQRVQMLKDVASIYLREPLVEPVEETWIGWRPMTSDDRPIIGHSPTLKNVLIAAGHGMLGLTLAPATGRLITEMLSGQTPHVDPAPFSPGRFG